MAGVIAQQMVGFAIMLLIGFFAARASIVTREALPSIIMLVQSVFLPIMTFNFIYRGMTVDLIVSHLPLIPMTAIFYPAIIGIMWLVARALGLSGGKSAAFRMTFIFGNTGFIGLPLLAAVYPDTGVADLSLFMLVDQLVLWTYGASIASGRRVRQSPAQLAKRFFSPNVISILLGFAVVLAGIVFPPTVENLVNVLGGVASPLCMVCLGSMCFYSNMREAFRRKELYVGVALKMIALPVIVSPLVLGLPFAYDVRASMLIMMSMPATTLVPLIVESNGGDDDYAVSMTVATIAISVASVPFAALLAGI